MQDKASGSTPGPNVEMRIGESLLERGDFSPLQLAPAIGSSDTSGDPLLYLAVRCHSAQARVSRSKK